MMEKVVKEMGEMMTMVKYLLLLLVVIFTFVGNSYGQCAWVLWKQSGFSYEIYKGGDIKPGPESNWQIISAFPKYEQCAERQKQEFLKYRDYIKEQKNYSFMPLRYTNAETKFESIMGSYTNSSNDLKVYFSVEWKCLPDSIDLRK